jgi:hypothetical protein
VAAARWQQLGVLLDSVAARPGARDKLVRAAKTAFECVAHWFKSSP